MQIPLQQSAGLVQPEPVSSQGTSQTPPRHSPPQQSALVMQASPVGTHGSSGGRHVPSWQLVSQHSALNVQGKPVSMQAGSQRSTPVPSSRHWPLQQSASSTQMPPVGLQMSSPYTQMGGSCVSSHT